MSPPCRQAKHNLNSPTSWLVRQELVTSRKMVVCTESTLRSGTADLATYPRCSALRCIQSLSFTCKSRCQKCKSCQRNRVQVQSCWNGMASAKDAFYVISWRLQVHQRIVKTATRARYRICTWLLLASSWGQRSLSPKIPTSSLNVT